MVAVIKTGSSVRRLVNYNENKVKQGVAQCIEASNYPMDADKLSVRQKLSCLVKQAALNENVKRSSVHISLNFGPGERVGVENLKAIADTYMQGIGFGINIRADGSRIDMQNIGRNRSEKVRKEIEESFGLVRARQSGQKQNHRPEPIGVTRVRYGKTETKKAIGTVLDFVLKNYRYASLPELNAVLGQYNVRADCGK
ncbi:MAG: relaxase, partial [Cytophagales bacterium]|nr:relaxase [Cytophagales bacterium]